jgi:hypothetical protein
MPNRTDPEKHRAQVRAANRARYRALQRLVTENQIRFDELYSEEALREGVAPKPRGRIDVEVIQHQIASLEARLATIKKGSSA